MQTGAAHEAVPEGADANLWCLNCGGARVRQGTVGSEESGVWARGDCFDDAAGITSIFCRRVSATPGKKILQPYVMRLSVN